MAEFVAGMAAGMMFVVLVHQVSASIEMARRHRREAKDRAKRRERGHE